MTQLKREEASRLPRIDAPVPPGATFYFDPLAVRAKVIELVAEMQPKRREASKVQQSPYLHAKTSHALALRAKSTN
jgi:hypothetical protein